MFSLAKLLAHTVLAGWDADFGEGFSLCTHIAGAIGAVAGQSADVVHLVWYVHAFKAR